MYENARRAKRNPNTHFDIMCSKNGCKIESRRRSTRDGYERPSPGYRPSHFVQMLYTAIMVTFQEVAVIADYNELRADGRLLGKQEPKGLCWHSSIAAAIGAAASRKNAGCRKMTKTYQFTSRRAHGLSFDSRFMFAQACFEATCANL